MKISSLPELMDLADRNDVIFAILNDMTIGRKKASDRLHDYTEYDVSEKLVRSYRAFKKVNELYPVSALPLVNSVEDYQYTISVEPVGEPISYKEYLQVPTPKKSNKSSKTIVVMPDVQAPLHDVELVNKFISFLGDYKPDELAQVGDFTDSTEISRWVRGKKPEFAGDLKSGFISARNILKDIREVFDGRFRIVRSNHDDRLELYVQACAPGLASFLDDELSLETLVHFDKYDVEFIRDEVVELAPGWVMAHGDEGSLSPSAGKTAFGLAKNKFGVSTVCGHTHRAGMTSESTGYNGKIRNTLTGMEVGHFMDLTKADYLKKKGVAANWQQAFGIIETIHGKTFPRLITVQDGNFYVDGVLY